MLVEPREEAVPHAPVIRVVLELSMPGPSAESKKAEGAKGRQGVGLPPIMALGLAERPAEGQTNKQSK